MTQDQMRDRIRTTLMVARLDFLMEDAKLRTRFIYCASSKKDKYLKARQELGLEPEEPLDPEKARYLVCYYRSTGEETEEGLEKAADSELRKFVLRFGGDQAKADEALQKMGLDRESFKVLTKQDCYYCGKSPSQLLKHNTANGGYIYNGIDRVDNTKGYIFTNCVSCCKECNIKKSSITINMAKKMLAFVGELEKDYE